MLWARGDYDSEETRHRKSEAMKAAWDCGAYDGNSEALKAAHERGDFDNCSEAMKIAWANGIYDGNSEATKAAWKRGDYDSEECRRKKSEAMKNAWERGDLGDEEWHRRQSESKKVAWERGDYDSRSTDEYRRKLSEAAKAHWEREGTDGISEIMRARWERGVYGDEEWRRKKSEATKAAWERGDHGEERNRKVSEAMKAAWARGDFDGVFQSPTSIELQVAAALDILGIEHQSQYRPDGYSCIYDEFVPPYTLIEIHGDYFHSEEHFPGIEQRDAEKAQWAEDNGFELVVIWEHEIREQGADSIIAQRILDRGY